MHTLYRGEGTYNEIFTVVTYYVSAFINCFSRIVPDVAIRNILADMDHCKEDDL